MLLERHSLLCLGLLAVVVVFVGAQDNSSLTPFMVGSGSGEMTLDPDPEPDHTNPIPNPIPPTILVTFHGLSLTEFHSTVMIMLLTTLTSITSEIEVDIMLVSTEAPSSNVTTATLYFNSTEMMDDLSVAMSVYSLLNTSNHSDWLMLRHQYAVVLELMAGEATATSPPLQPSPAGILTIWQWIIVSVAATVILIASLLTMSYCCHYLLVARQRNKPAKGYAQYLSPGKEFQQLPANRSVMEMDGIQIPPRRVARIAFPPKGMLQQLSHPLSSDELDSLVNNTSALYGEYASIPTNMVTMSEVPPGAEDKNRYRDVLPNPYTRVSLFLKFGVANSDYINANFIRGYKDSSKTYIATQGPLQWTVADFWRMVWEQRCSTIIMVTNLEERGTNKCSRYWPDVTINHSTTYEDLVVRLKKRMSSSNNHWVTTTFHVTHKQKMVSREVSHYWFTDWPDHGVPATAKPTLEFLLQVRSGIRDMPGSTVVHCSAGIGRTGVVIGADIGMQQLEEEGNVDVLKIVSTLRQDRGGMIQTRDQYVFLHKVLLEYGYHLSQLRTYRGGVTGQSLHLPPTIEEDFTDTSSLLQ